MPELSVSGAHGTQHFTQSAPGTEIYCASQRAGTISSSGNAINNSTTSNSAMRNGRVPLTVSMKGTFDTPETTFSTRPTGGVIRPMAQVITNSTPKYTGSMPAASATGSITGTRIRMIGDISIAMPTAMMMATISSISRRGLSISGSSRPMISAGRSATVITQAATSAEATRNITMLVVVTADDSTP